MLLTACTIILTEELGVEAVSKLLKELGASEFQLKAITWVMCPGIGMKNGEYYISPRELGRR